jgi:hypothetical protein
MNLGNQINKNISNQEIEQIANNFVEDIINGVVNENNTVVNSNIENNIDVNIENNIDVNIENNIDDIIDVHNDLGNLDDDYVSLEGDDSDVSINDNDNNGNNDDDNDYDPNDPNGFNKIKTIFDDRDTSNHTPKIIYYYQTFCSLDSILHPSTKVTHIHLAAVHFGYSKDRDGINYPYIHLNNYSPGDPRFNHVWNQLSDAKSLGIKVILMIGGAGTAYQMLFSNYEVFYDLLKETINKNRDIIDGVDLDIEESIKLSQIRSLINDIDEDFGENFIISMAPVQFTMENPNEPGMSGFKYSQLYKTYEGRRIDYFNVQAYSSYSCKALDNIVSNGYPVEKIVMGMLTGQDYQNIKSELSNMIQKYELNFGGVFIWEYYDAPPMGINDPSEWSREMSSIIYAKKTLANTILENCESMMNSTKNNIKDFFYTLYYSKLF